MRSCNPLASPGRLAQTYGKALRSLCTQIPAADVSLKHGMRCHGESYKILDALTRMLDWQQIGDLAACRGESGGAYLRRRPFADTVESEMELVIGKLFDLPNAVCVVVIERCLRPERLDKLENVSLCLRKRHQRAAHLKVVRTTCGYDTVAGPAGIACQLDAALMAMCHSQLRRLDGQASRRRTSSVDQHPLMLCGLPRTRHGCVQTLVQCDRESDYTYTYRSSSLIGHVPWDFQRDSFPDHTVLAKAAVLVATPIGSMSHSGDAVSGLVSLGTLRSNFNDRTSKVAADRGAWSGQDFIVNVLPGLVLARGPYR